MQTEKPPFDDLRVRQALSEAIRREAFAELGKQTGVVGTGNYPLGPWAMPKTMREQLIGYGPDMPRRIAHAKELLAAYEKEKGMIDWGKLKLQCSTNIPVTCENAQIIQQLLKKLNVNIELEPMLVAQHRGNEVSGDYLLSTLLAGFDFDDPIDTFGQMFVSKGGRWYQRHSVPEIDQLFEQQKFGFDHGAGHPILFLDDAKAPNCRKNNGFKDLGNYSEWPKVAGAVIKAKNSLPRWVKILELGCSREVTTQPSLPLSLVFFPAIPDTQHWCG